MEKLIKKIPSWARWILVPFSAYVGLPLAAYMGGAFIALVFKMTGKSISWELVSFMQQLKDLGCGFLPIYSGTLMAPRHKLTSGLILAGLMTLSLFSIRSESRPMTYTIAGTWVGLGFIAIQNRGRQPENPNLG
jgi:hypothetical protein